MDRHRMAMWWRIYHPFWVAFDMLRSGHRRPLGCYDCGLRYGSDAWCDVVLADADWLSISPTGNEGGILCFSCIARRLTKMGRAAEVTMVAP